MGHIIGVDALWETLEDLRAEGMDFVEIELCEADEQSRAHIALTSWSAGGLDRQVSKLFCEK